MGRMVGRECFPARGTLGGDGRQFKDKACHKWLKLGLPMIF